MKRQVLFLNAVLIVLAFPLFTNGQRTSHWPKIISENGIKTAVFQPKTESLNKNILTAHADVSVRSQEDPDPVFGTIWFTGIISVKGDKKMLSLETMDITDVRIPDLTDTIKLIRLKSLLERELPLSGVVFNRDSLTAQVANYLTQITGSTALNTAPPKIIYTSRPTLLVIVDGDPKLGKIENSPLKRVVNTPYVIVYNENDRNYYLNADKYWYNSPELTGNWKYSDKVPAAVAEVDRQMKADAAKDNNSVETGNFASPPEVIVSTTPAELIQTNGEVDLQPVEGTTLWYAANSGDNIFKDPQGGFYYILLSGRWYTGKSLDGPWAFVPSDQLPKQFSNIPEGWEKDNVRSSIAGTWESHDAVKNAEVPQTARVDRKSVISSISYDGDPDFQPVDGVQNTWYASNTSSSVLRIGNVYYCVDNGIWYVSNGPYGPWQVATDRPGEVEQIPASCPVYNVKYVYIYDVTPEYVYMGYTPGYTGCYVLGSTVIYGTGYYYTPWYSQVYYPRPFTWGFSMTYDPWSGWCFGSNNYWVGYSQGYYDGYRDARHDHHHHGGWWGPSSFRPPAYYSHHGHDGSHINGRHNPSDNRGSVRPGSLYNDRKDVRNIGKNSQYTNDANKKVPPGSYSNGRSDIQNTGKVFPSGNSMTNPGGKGTPGPTGKPINTNGNLGNEKVRPGSQPSGKPGTNDNNTTGPSGKPINNNQGSNNNGKVRPSGNVWGTPGDNSKTGPTGKPINNQGNTRGETVLPGDQPRGKPDGNDNNKTNPGGRPINNQGGSGVNTEKGRPDYQQNNSNRYAPQPSTKPSPQPTVQPQTRPGNQPSGQPSGKPGQPSNTKPSGKTGQQTKEAPGKRDGK